MNASNEKLYFSDNNGVQKGKNEYKKETLSDEANGFSIYFLSAGSGTPV